MRDIIEPLHLGVRWAPNAPFAVLTADDNGSAFVALAPHFNDPDARQVIIPWSGCVAASMLPFNDEGIGDHPLWGRGLDGVRWAAEVLHSSWIASFGAWTEGRELRHFILLLKERTIEVAAEGWTIERRER